MLANSPGRISTWSTRPAIGERTVRRSISVSTAATSASAEATCDSAIARSGGPGAGLEQFKFGTELLNPSLGDRYRVPLAAQFLLCNRATIGDLVPERKLLLKVQNTRLRFGKPRLRGRDEFHARALPQAFQLPADGFKLRPLRQERRRKFTGVNPEERIALRNVSSYRREHLGNDPSHRSADRDVLRTRFDEPRTRHEGLERRTRRADHGRLGQRRLALADDGDRGEDHADDREQRQDETTEHREDLLLSFGRDVRRGGLVAFTGLNLHDVTVVHLGNAVGELKDALVVGHNDE